MEIRGKTISYSSYKKKQNQQKEEKLEKEIEQMEELEHIDTEMIKNKKLELENLRKERIQGIMIRAKIKWAEEGEKPTKYFCSLEARNYINKTVPKIQTDDGNIIQEQQDILKEIKHFYSDLYKGKERSQETDYQEILNTLDHPILTQLERSKIEGEITEDEIAHVLKNMKNNKSPGSDGFTVEFFKFFFKDLKTFIKRGINEGYLMGKFSITQRQGIITCIPKGDKPRHFLKNWRPITLLNVIYKIASGCIANRLKSVLPKLISSDQTGFISGRYIGENTRLIYDIMDHVDKEYIPGLLLIVDFEKAFDSISWEFIADVLDFFNFGPSIKKWISVLYNDILSAIIQSGFLSDFFSIGRGCRQGDPSSSYIFLLCAEVLSLMLKQNAAINGIKIGDVEYLLSQFADDTTIILDGSQQSLETAISILNLFASMSGLKVNNSKTRAVWIGCRKFSGETFNHRLKLNWNQTDFEILGIKFSCNLDTMTEINYKEKIKQIDIELKQWSKRKLTPFGRITVLKTLIISKLNHLFIALPDPKDEVIYTLQKNFFHFIWQSGTDRVKRELLMQNYETGGLKMINLRNYIYALKSTWIRRLIINDSKYKTIFETKYSKVEDLINRGLDFARFLKTNKNNKFWNNVLEAWLVVCEKQIPTKFEDILSTNLWNNKELKINNKAIFYRHWYDKHIHYIKDLFNDDGRLMNYNQFIQKFEVQTNFIQFYGVRAAVELYIRNKGIAINTNILTNNYLPFKIKVLLKNERGSRDMYELINKKNIIPSSQVKWNTIFEPIHLNWSQLYNIPAKSCNNTKLHWFQYRLLHRILATNDFLFKCNIKQDNLCNFCKRFPEKLEHIFWYCTLIMEFWEDIEMWIYEKSNYLLNIDMQRAILGITNVTENNKSINYILILTRYYIYKCRINGNRPSIAEWIKEVTFFIHIEKMIAIKTDRYPIFIKHWGKWLNLLEL